VVHQERRHSYAVCLVHDTLADVGCGDFDPARRKFLIHVAPHVNIERKRFLQMHDHRASAFWPPHLKRYRPTLGPGKEPELRQRNDVIRVKMGQEYLRYLGGIDRQFRHSRRQAASRIEQQPFRPGFNQRADAQSLCVERGTSGRPEQNDADGRIGAGRWRLLRSNSMIGGRQQQQGQENGRDSHVLVSRRCMCETLPAPNAACAQCDGAHCRASGE